MSHRIFGYVVAGLVGLWALLIIGILIGLWWEGR